MKTFFIAAITFVSFAQAAEFKLGSIRVEKNQQHGEESKMLVRPVQCLRAISLQAHKWSAAVQIDSVKASYAIEGTGVKREKLDFKGLLKPDEFSGWLAIPQNGLCVTAIIVEAKPSGNTGAEEDGKLFVFGAN